MLYQTGNHHGLVEICEPSTRTIMNNTPQSRYVTRSSEPLIRPRVRWFCLASAAATCHAAPVPVSGSGAYSQNFDTLPASGTAPWTDDSMIAGWYSQRSGSGVDILAGTGSSTAGGLYSYGPTSSAERALGTLGSGVVGSFAHGLLLQNSSEVPVTINSLAYTGEQWRKSGETDPQVVTLWYKLSQTAVTTPSPASDVGWTAISPGGFSSPVNTTTGAALDGNEAANRVPVAINPNLSIPGGHYLMLRWKDPDHTGTDHGLAIDDVSVSWVVSPVITLTASPGTFPENAGSGASAATVTIPTALAADLVLDLSSSDPTAATVPPSVTITAGNTSANFAISAVDDAIIDGTQTATLTASAAGYAPGSALVEVTDDGEPPPAATLSPGAIAFTGFNADGNDDLAFVALVPIAETDVIHFTENSWNGLPMSSGGLFAGSEGHFTWTAPAGGIAAGTVVTLNHLATAGRSASVGTIMVTGGSLNLGGTEETVYAYQGNPQAPTGFLAVIATHDGDSTAGTGLGTAHILELPDDADIAAYKGPRSGETGFAAYLARIGDISGNWISGDGAGDQSNDTTAPDVPFDITPFTIIGAAGYSSWATNNAGDQRAGLDYDGDGIDNGTEYFMGTAGNAFTPNPGAIGGTVTWPRAAGTTISSFRVEVSENLSTWEDAAIHHAVRLNIGPSSVAFNMPPAPGKFFVRLSVTP
jgi:hypothetical protein